MNELISKPCKKSSKLRNLKNIQITELTEYFYLETLNIK